MLLINGLINVFTDIDECLHGTSTCSSNANCVNTQGSYHCQCADGYHGDGINCYDDDECSNGPCHRKAVCSNNEGSYNCRCNFGYHGNGFSCFDRDECAQEDHRCHKKARCINNEGSYNFLCEKGYHGNGRLCKALSAERPVLLNGGSRLVVTVATLLQLLW